MDWGPHHWSITEEEKISRFLIVKTLKVVMGVKQQTPEEEMKPLKQSSRIDI